MIDLFKKLFVDQRTEEQEFQQYENDLTPKQKLAAYRSMYPLDDIKFVENLIFNQYDIAVKLVREHYSREVANLTLDYNGQDILTETNKILKEAIGTLDVLAEEYRRIEQAKSTIEVVE